MCIAPVRSGSNKRRSFGFTLLEIMLAVAILAMMSTAIYRFVQSNMLAMRISTDASAADAKFDSLRDLLTAQFQSLPSGVGALTGDPLKLNDRSRDEVRWISGAGLGVLTRYAGTNCTVALRLQQE